MTTKRMKSREVRDNWRETLRHVEGGGTVVIEHYNRPIARIVPIEEPIMTTTTSYGTFTTHCADSGSSASITDYVAGALGDFAGDYDVDAVTDGFRDAINAELDGTGVSLHGDEFYGPHPREDVDIAAAIERVDFWEIAAKHEHS